MRRKGSLTICAAVGIAAVVSLAATGLARAGSTEDSTFMLRNTATFAAPALDMVQGYTPGGASTSCPGPLGHDWTCTWSSDPFIAGQSMAAGTAAVHFYPENGGGPITLRDAETTYSRITTYYRILQSGDGDPDITIPSSWSGNAGGLGAQIAVWRHVDVSNPFDAADVVGDSAAADQWDAPAMSTVTYSTRVISAVATADTNALAMVTANGFASVMGGASYDTTTGGDMAVGVSELHAWIGAQTMPRWDQTANGSDAWAGITFALRLDPDVTIASPPAPSPATSWRRRSPCARTRRRSRRRLGGR